LGIAENPHTLSSHGAFLAAAATSFREDFLERRLVDLLRPGEWGIGRVIQVALMMRYSK
jgi:hypothetical protein